MHQDRFYTVWQFSNLQGEKNIVVRNAEPNDKQVQHEYQRVLAQVWAPNPKQALAQYQA